MKTVRASCPDCGDVETNTAKLRIVTCAQGDEEFHNYRFRCPVCQSIVLKEIEGDRILDILLEENVEREYLMPPKLDYGYGEAISHDDVIDFAENASNDEEFDKAMQEFLSES